MGQVRTFTGGGSPTWKAPIGTLAINQSADPVELYVNYDGETGWVRIDSIGFVPMEVYNELSEVVDDIVRTLTSLGIDLSAASLERVFGSKGDIR